MSESDEDEGLGPTNRQIHVLDMVRDYISEESTRRDQTHSEFLMDVLPEDHGSLELGYDEDSIVYLKTTEEVDDIVNDLTLDRVRFSKGEAIALFVMLHALENGDYQVASHLVEEVAEPLWDLLGVQA